jgi:outer membrane protein TolC
MTRPPSSPFLGGVPEGTASPEPLTLSIGGAIRRALDHNLGVLLAEDRVEAARGSRWTALGGLLPDVTGSLTGSRRKINLEAFGFPLGDEFPRVVGPFNVFDARLFVSQPVIDLAALNGTRAEAHNLAAARHDYRSARDLVVLVSANLYLQTLAAAARTDTARAQLDTAEALYAQAQDLRKSGIIAGLDVIRAEVRVSEDRQRATAANNAFQISKLQLARVAGLPVGQEFTLSAELPEVPEPAVTFDDALARAYRTRPDYLAAQERVRGAEAAHAAARTSALPSLHVNADYGAIGLTADSALATFNVTGAVNVPVFEGGRLQARLARTDADLRSRRAEADDLRAGIYYDVRTAFLNLAAASDELQTATRARDLAARQLEQSRDRFAAGITDNIEVIQAQETVTRVNEQYIAARYGYDITKVLLMESIGSVEDSLGKLFGGVTP